MLIVNQAHLRSVLADYAAYDNHRRPHQGRDQGPPVPLAAAPPRPAAPAQIRSRPVLGGLIGECGPGRPRRRATACEADGGSTSIGCVYPPSACQSRSPSAPSLAATPPGQGRSAALRVPAGCRCSTRPLWATSQWSVSGTTRRGIVKFTCGPFSAPHLGTFRPVWGAREARSRLIPAHQAPLSDVIRPPSALT